MIVIEHHAQHQATSVVLDLKVGAMFAITTGLRGGGDEVSVGKRLRGHRRSLPEQAEELLLTRPGATS